MTFRETCWLDSELSCCFNVSLLKNHKYMWTTHTHSHVFFLEIRSNINFSSTNPNLPVTLTCNDLRVCPHEELRTAECDHVNTSMSSQHESHLQLLTLTPGSLRVPGRSCLTFQESLCACLVCLRVRVCVKGQRRRVKVSLYEITG